MFSKMIKIIIEIGLLFVLCMFTDVKYVSSGVEAISKSKGKINYIMKKVFRGFGLEKFQSKT